MNQSEPRVAAGPVGVGEMAQVAAQADKHALLILRVERGAQIFEVAAAVDEASLACRAYALEANARKLGRALVLNAPALGQARGQHVLPIRDDPFETVAPPRPPSVARERPRRAL